MKFLILLLSALLLVPAIFSQTSPSSPSLAVQKKQLLDELDKTRPEIKEARAHALKAVQTYADEINKRPELAEFVKVQREKVEQLMKALAAKDAQASNQLALDLQKNNKLMDETSLKDPVLKELHEVAVTAQVKSMKLETEALEATPEGRELLQKIRDSKKKK